MKILCLIFAIAAPLVLDQFGAAQTALRSAAAQTATSSEPKQAKAAQTEAPDETNLAKTAKITCSDKQSPRAKNRPQVNGRAAKDGREPKSSHDNSPLSHFDWWPDRDVTQWCEYSWEQPVSVSQTQLYWWDDSQHGGGCKTPVSWKAFYKVGDDWKPVDTKDKYGIEVDKYNKVEFKPVDTRGLRLEIVAPKDGSVGIQEWKTR